MFKARRIISTRCFSDNRCIRRSWKTAQAQRTQMKKAFIKKTCTCSLLLSPHLAIASRAHCVKGCKLNELIYIKFDCRAVPNSPKTTWFCGTRRAQRRLRHARTQQTGSKVCLVACISPRAQKSPEETKETLCKAAIKDTHRLREFSCAAYGCRALSDLEGFGHSARLLLDLKHVTW